MTPTIKHNDIVFIDAQAMRLMHPETFEAPSKEELNKLKAGDYVKVCVNDERFWIEVGSVNGEIITGKVDNNLLQKCIKYNDIVEFPKNCIFNIIDGDNT